MVVVLGQVRRQTRGAAGQLEQRLAPGSGGGRGRRFAQEFVQPLVHAFQLGLAELGQLGDDFVHTHVDVMLACPRAKGKRGLGTGDGRL